MSNIFNFLPGRKETPNSDFLKDADDTVEFVHTGKDVHIGETPKHFLNTNYAETLLRDWSNQELANIYRVKTLLDAAGVPNELERGISDEGDPWCIFCSATGEVFIHLSRIDGGYVLDSPNLRAPIFGVDFAELIQEFSAGALGSSPAAEKGSRRVVKLHRNGKVFLHPSALLAALVWSIYLNSEDLVMFAPEDEALDGSAGESAIALVNEMAAAPMGQEDTATAAHFLNSTVQPDQMITTRLADAGSARDVGLVKDISGKMAMVAAHTPIAVGLSSIAIAFGIMSEGFFDPATPDVIATPDVLVVAAAADITPAEREQDTGSRSPQFDLIAVLQSAFNHAPATPEQMQSALSIEIAGGIDLSTLLASVLPPEAPSDIDINLKGAFEKSWEELGLQEAVLYAEAREKQQTKTTDTLTTESQTTTASKETTSDTTDIMIASAKVDPVIDLVSLTAFKAYTTNAFQTFDVGGVMVEATFDIASLSPDTTSLLGPWSDPSADVSGMDAMDETDTINLGVVDDNPFTTAPGFDLIDINAQAFIEYLISRDAGVEMISRPTEFVLLDFSALTSGEATHSMGWELEDGNTIFTVGLRSDFIEYDLIA